MTATATWVANLKGFQGDARLYRLDPPLEVTDWAGEDAHTVEWVIVSAIIAFFSGPETYIFEADETGEVKSWMDLEGSFRGALDHEQALNGAGYEVIR